MFWWGYSFSHRKAFLCFNWKDGNHIQVSELQAKGGMTPVVQVEKYRTSLPEFSRAHQEVRWKWNAQPSPMSVHTEKIIRCVPWKKEETNLTPLSSQFES